MSRWFRFYDDALNDPKVQLLPNGLFKAWVNILCLASKNGGQIIPNQVAFALRCSGEEAGAIIKSLTEAELLDNIDGKITPHNWSGRQYDNRDGANRLAGASGDSTAAARMQRHRNKHRNEDRNTTVTDTVTPTVTEPYQEQNRAEQIQSRTEKKEKKSGKMLLPDVWAISPVHYDLAKKLGLPIEEVGEAAAEMRAWSLGNGERRRDWDMVFSNWLRRNAEKKRKANGFRGLQDDSRSLTKAADRLIEANKRGEFSFGPRPGLSAEPSENVVQLLPKGRGE